TATPTPPRKLCPQLPRVLEQICLKCLEHDPAERYPSALLLAEHLEGWLRGNPVRVPRRSLISKARALVRRRPFLVLTPILVGVIGFAWYVGISLSQPERKEEQDDVTGKRAALADLLKELRERRAVTLIPATGLPRYYKWRINQVLPHRTKEGAFSFGARDQ